VDRPNFIAKPAAWPFRDLHLRTSQTCGLRHIVHKLARPGNEGIGD